MNVSPNIVSHHSTCPHDCPSCCALEVEVVDGTSIGRVRGGKMDYTAGVICAKVARYAERIHHADRLTKPLRRTGPKGTGQFAEIGWDEALDRVAAAFQEAAAKHGSEAVWPYFYAGTMGLIQRDGINRLRHVMRYSGQYDTICTNMAWNGFIAGTGKLAGADPREMAQSDLVIIWGTNAVSTQVNVMTHAVRARKERGARIAVIDVYDNDTMKQADIALCLRPGTDGALACAIMHVLFRDGHADWAYLERYTDDPKGLEAHLQDKTPHWASAITGLPVDTIEDFATAIGTTERSFFRLGYGFTRSRNGSVAMHAALSIPAVTGAWRREGGGAFHNNGGIYNLNATMNQALDARDPQIRLLDQSRIGAILEGEAADLQGGPPVAAMLVQNTNPVSVAPEQERVKRGFARDDLFVCVHEQFMTETAHMADIVLPATMFMEHDDIYRGGGHQNIMLGPKLIDPPAGCRSNHEVICALAERLGAGHPGFSMSPRDHIDWMLQNSGWGTLADLEETGWLDCQPDFDAAHYIDGFGWPDGKFRFKPDWAAFSGVTSTPMGPWRQMPTFPDHWDVTENVDDTHPYRLVTAPARSFLNSTFNETGGSLKREGRPEVMIHPNDAARDGIADGDRVELFNRRGTVRLHARHYDGIQRGVVIAEGLWPNDAFENGKGINTLVGAEPVAPAGGAAFHDSHVGIRRLEPQSSDRG